MPSGLRFGIKVEKKLYNFSPLQWNLLQKKSIKLTGEWAQDRSLRGLIKQRLFDYEGGKGLGKVRQTALGAEVVKALKAKLKAKDSKGA